MESFVDAPHGAPKKEGAAPAKPELQEAIEELRKEFKKELEEMRSSLKEQAKRLAAIEQRLPLRRKYTRRAKAEAEQPEGGEMSAAEADQDKAAAKAKFSAESVAKIRLAKGLTQEQLAILLGVKKNNISHWETGRCKPRAAARNKLIELQKKSIHELLAMLKTAGVDTRKARMRQVWRVSASGAGAGN